MKILFTCGGTAGHINPALAVAGRLRELREDCECLFIGAEGMMEMQLVPREGYEIRSVKVTNLSREKSLSGLRHNAESAVNLVKAMAEARSILKDFRPDAAVGTGGYVCYPVLSEAHRLGIPTLVHESNAVPGLTTKLLSQTVDRILLGFEDSRQYYPKPERLAVTGTPVRGGFARMTRESARRELGLKKDDRLVLSVWGSLGSGHINAMLPELLTLMRKTKGFHLIHAVGSRDYSETMAALSALSFEPQEAGAEIREYIYDMPRLTAAADLIVCRAGASTLSELSFMGKPALLIPSPNVTNNHQEKNARVLEKAGGARVLLEGEFTAESLLQEIERLLNDPGGLRRMSESMLSLAVPEATDRIAGEILSLVQGA